MKLNETNYIGFIGFIYLYAIIKDNNVMLYDFKYLNERADIRELYERITSNTLRKHSETYEGPCPLCGGDDRFYIYYNDTPQHWFCRQCHPESKGGRAYTAMDFIKDVCHMEYDPLPAVAEKLASYLNLPNDNCAQYKGASKEDKAEQAPKLYETLPELPSKEWQAKVTEAVMTAHSVLWQPEYRPQLDYLRGRGFTDETLKKYCIGYYPKKYSLDIQDEKGNPIEAKRGFYIPTFMRLSDNGKSNVLTRVKVRYEDSVYKYLLSKYEADPDHNHKPDKYVSIRDSKGITLFGNQYVRPKTAGKYPNIIFVEGEFDAMTINQVASDICKAVTFGSHGNIGKAEAWVRWYTQPDNIVVCFDNETDEKKRKSVRQHELDLQSEIIRAQSVMPEDIRADAPVVRHLPEEYHDWNDILQLPNGKQIIRQKLSEWFSGNYDGH